MVCPRRETRAVPINPDDMKPAGGDAQPSPQATAPASPLAAPAPQVSAPTQPTPRKPLSRVAIFIIGFAISLAIGWLVQEATNPETLASAKQAQDSWKIAVETSQPFAILDQYWNDVQTIWNGAPPDPDTYSLSNSGGGGIATPIIALAVTGTRLFETGGVWALINLALAGLSIAVYNYRRTRGDSIFFDDYVGNVIMGPFLLIGISSVIALVLQVVMAVALAALSWVTDLAAAAAGATGVVGFCWFCLTELGKKGAEHVITPKFKA
jgi:hypothetical protein